MTKVSWSYVADTMFGVELRRKLQLMCPGSRNPMRSPAVRFSTSSMPCCDPARDEFPFGASDRATCTSFCGILSPTGSSASAGVGWRVSVAAPGFRRAGTDQPTAEALAPADEFALRGPFLVISPPKTASTWLAETCAATAGLCSCRQRGQVLQLLFAVAGPELVSASVPGGRRAGQGQASPSYAILPLETIRRIRGLMPDLKLIFMMREPIARSWSHAKHNYRFCEANFADTACEFAAVSESRWRENFVHEWPLASGDYLGSFGVGCRSSHASKSTSTSTSRLPTTRSSCSATFGVSGREPERGPLEFSTRGKHSLAGCPASFHLRCGAFAAIARRGRRSWRCFCGENSTELAPGVGGQPRVPGRLFRTRGRCRDAARGAASRVQ